MACGDHPAGVAGAAGQITISQIARGLGAGSGQQSEEPNPVACGELLAECWEKMLELVQNYELDLSRET